MEVASPTPKKILYVITKSNWGGAQRHVYDLALAAKAAGYEVLVAAGGNGELITRLGPIEGVSASPMSCAARCRRSDVYRRRSLTR